MSKNLILLFIPILLFSANCAKKETVHIQQTPQGGQDSGGGNFVSSDRDAIIKTLNYIRERSIVFHDTPLFYMHTTNFLDNLKNDKLHLLLEDIQKRVNEKFSKKYLLNMKKYLRDYYWKDQHKKVDDPNVLDNFDFRVASLFLLSEIKFGDDEVCKENIKYNLDHKDAFVVEHKIGSPICFNLENLTKYPSDTLFSSLNALYIHEFMHILGYGEEEALFLQQFIFRNFDYFNYERTDENDSVFKTTLKGTYLLVYRDIEKNWSFLADNLKSDFTKDLDLVKSCEFASYYRVVQIIRHNIDTIDLAEQLEQEELHGKKLDKNAEKNYGVYVYFRPLKSALLDINNYFELVESNCGYNNFDALKTDDALQRKTKFLQALDEIKVLQEKVKQEKAWVD